MHCSALCGCAPMQETGPGSTSDPGSCSSPADTAESGGRGRAWNDEKALSWFKVLLHARANVHAA